MFIVFGMACLSPHCYRIGFVRRCGRRGTLHTPPLQQLALETAERPLCIFALCCAYTLPDPPSPWVENFLAHVRREAIVQLPFRTHRFGGATCKACCSPLRVRNRPNFDTNPKSLRIAQTFAVEIAKRGKGLQPTRLRRRPAAAVKADVVRAPKTRCVPSGLQKRNISMACPAPHRSSGREVIPAFIHLC